MDESRGAPASLTTNKQIEDAAVRYVLKWEAAQGREASDTRGQGAAADLISGDRVIEVKAYGLSARGADLWLEVRQVEEAKANKNFWLYLVENVRQGDPSMFRHVELGGDVLAQLVSRAVPRHYFTVPFPVATYDELFADQR
ncbi:MAG: hypothetical protein QOJ11_421 [Frankiales bacterium]|jgi:hypothetical protein|nr:hypothetical protein [Frankiales bacterium]